MKHTETLFENIGALEEGVLIPTCDVKKQLSKMSPIEARIATRKWRKLMRRAKKEIPEGKTVTKGLQMYFVRKRLRQKGRERLSL